MIADISNVKFDDIKEIYDGLALQESRIMTRILY
jgi:hypothetical protein